MMWCVSDIGPRGDRNIVWAFEGRDKGPGKKRGHAEAAFEVFPLTVWDRVEYLMVGEKHNLHLSTCAWLPLLLEENRLVVCGDRSMFFFFFSRFETCCTFPI